jgi:L-fucose isomerase-like protein
VAGKAGVAVVWAAAAERKRVGEGKRGEPGGRRIIEKKTGGTAKAVAVKARVAEVWEVAVGRVAATKAVGGTAAVAAERAGAARARVALEAIPWGLPAGGTAKAVAVKARVAVVWEVAAMERAGAAEAGA